MLTNKSMKETMFLLSGGILVGLILSKYLNMHNKKKKEFETECDDDCKSLFYTAATGAEGSGMPFANKDLNTEQLQLKSVKKEYIKLSASLYSQAVELLPLVCVDIVCQRKIDNKILLFYRRDKPANDIWWWPGGRMFRGETFFDTAIRKIRGETGNENAAVTPIGIIDVWNTFFPNSNWDKDRKPGFEGTQTVNICVFCTIDEETKLDLQDSAKDWAVEKHRWATVSELLEPGKFDKYVALNTHKAIAKGYLEA